MGYKRTPTLYVLDFIGTEDEGLVVKMTNLSVGKLLEMDKWQAASSSGNEEGTLKLLKEFTDHLFFWNLEDDKGKEVPATLKGVYTQDLDFILMLINKWLETIFGISGDLGKDSTSGQVFPEDSIPMMEL